MVDSSNVPISRACSTMSVLSMVRFGRWTGTSVASSVTTRFVAV